jgi:hypothetical protein
VLRPVDPLRHSTGTWKVARLPHSWTKTTQPRRKQFATGTPKCNVRALSRNKVSTKQAG